ncbi:hypothetical protein D3C87_1982880 [compost metagenome]
MISTATLPYNARMAGSLTKASSSSARPTLRRRSAAATANWALNLASSAVTGAALRSIEA